MKTFETVIDPEMGDQKLPASQVPPTNTNDWSDEQKAALDKNRMVMYLLTLCFTGQKSLGVIHKSRTNNFPNGLAFLVMNS
jgi:hypothetical protein